MSDQAGESSGGSPPEVRRLDEWDAAALLELHSAYGSPLYVMDLDRVEENCRRLRSAFPDA
ncbi:MAG: diaminopimelate decarboxylase, partial [Halobacteriota archaeon]